ncbi:carbohydrate ABC transporter permease [Leifsonia sp. NPDC056824]|uniref:carbohydrate ABC transporter permease n=1 Tax=Leifsonia sp. NPDC056824 TaxID=3345953 RepID=UPI00368F41E6
MTDTTTRPGPTPVTTAAPRRRNTRGRTKSYNRETRRSTLLTVLLWICALYFVLPIVWLFIASTKSNGDLFTTFGFAFGHTFELFTNIGAVFTAQNGIYVHWAINTLVYALVSAVGASLLATMAGYAFAKYRFPGAILMFSVVLGAIMIPLTALALPTYLMFSQLGITNTPAAVIVPSLVSPFGVFLMRVYAADAIPDSMIEAGRVDGAGEFRIFWQVGLRLLAPGIVTVFLFALVGTWNNYFLPLIMLNSSQLYPLTVGLAQQQATSAAGGGSQALFSVVITGSLVSIIPLVIAFLFLQRYWTTGLASGSVKE